MTEFRIDGLDVFDVTRFLTKKRDKFIAIMLSDLELMFEPGSKEYNYVRKVILDGMNDYTRSIVRVIFGDVEGLDMK
jgi:hypothetical protein